MSKMTNTPENMKRLSEIKLFTLDMDGTIYLDATPLEGAIDFCKETCSATLPTILQRIPWTMWQSLIKSAFLQKDAIS